MANEAVGAIVVVIGGVWRNRDDCLEAFNPCGCGGQREGSVVRGSGHANVASAPVSHDLFVTVNTRVSLRAAIEPIDHALGRLRFVGSANCGAPFGETRTR